MSDLQALRGIEEISAVTIAAELARYLALVVRENQANRTRGRISKTGNAHLR